MGYNLFSEHGDTVGVGFARPKNTELLIKSVRETTDLGKGMALYLCVSVFQRKGCNQVFGLTPYMAELNVFLLFLFLIGNY